MKVSVKLQDHHQQTHGHDDKHNHHRLPPPPLLVRAKIPVTIFNLPFLSHFSTTTTHPSDLSLSLSTNFPSFPSLKLSYAATTTVTAEAAPPLSLTLKSGTGLFGSPNNSPLVISANFSFNPSNPNRPNPTFSLFFKPRLGSFSLRKSTFSHSDPTIGSCSDSNSSPDSLGFVPVESPAIVKDLSVVETENGNGNSILKGIQVAARTQMPVTKNLGLDFRWWVSFTEGNRMPVLRINKIGIRSVCDDVLVGVDDEKSKKKSDEGEVEVLKGMCFWMKKELDGLTRVNKEMKCELEEMKAGHLARNNVVERPDYSGGFEKWRNSKRKGEEIDGKKEEKKSGVGCVAAVDVENELERAIKAAASSSSSP